MPNFIDTFSVTLKGSSSSLSEAFMNPRRQRKRKWL